MRDFQEPEYKALRRRILKRDKRTCQYPDCNSRYRIQVHHILTWSSYPELRYEDSNSICLCANCHFYVRNNEGLFIELFTNIIAEKS